MYYTQILPRNGYLRGANDYDNATSRILSATSTDGVTWIPEPGVRLSPQEGGAGDFRVVSSEVVPVADHGGQLRMYYGRCRLYCNERGRGIMSAISDDGGLSFEEEPGIRIAPDQDFDRHTAFAPEIMRLPTGGYRMYYAGYSSPQRADILTAISPDGLNWQKASLPVLSPSSSAWDAAKCSEMCVICIQDGDPTDVTGFRMYYEACDGTAEDLRGVWRIASAIQR
jgi:predicted GH43/DUF377 family glycosyl hydrolase